MIQFEVLSLIDGDVVLLLGEPETSPSNAVPEVRKAPTDLLDVADVARVLGEAIAGGLTFEALKAFSRRVVASRRTTPESVAIDEVQEAVVRYLTSSGYLAIKVIEVQQLVGQGWSIEGKADSRRFTALAEESGRVVHVRVR